MALASGSPFYMLPASIKKMAFDLSALPAWYASLGGSVLLANEKQKIWLEKECRFPLSVTFVDTISDVYDEVLPWGWSPSLLHRLGESGVLGDVLISDVRMKQIRDKSSRKMAVEFLPIVRVEQTLGESFFVNNFTKLENLLSEYDEVILKSPWSGSGKGIQKVRKTLNDSIYGWAKRIMASQGGIVVEPYYQKALDFAMEFYAEEGKLSFVGYSIFETDSRGIYKGNLLASDEMLEKRLTSYVPLKVLLDIRRKCLEKLPNLINGAYNGYLGIDMMICLEGESYKVHPCVEINLRMNMGIVSRLLYDKYICQGVEGNYMVEFFQQPGEALQFHERMKQDCPLLIENGKINAGYLSLTPVFEDTLYHIFIKVK